MSYKEERNEKDEEDAERIRWELNTIRDDLLDELDELHDEFRDEIEEIIDESEEIKDELLEDLEELDEERDELFNEIGDVRTELESLDGDALDRIEKSREKLDRLREKIERYEDKLEVKVQKKLEKAKRKAIKRINISVDEDMSEEWKDWAEGLGASVSELVRKSMKFVKNNIGDISKLEQLGSKLEKMGEGLEKAVKESGIEELGEKLEKKFGKQKGKIHVEITSDSDKERIMKRVGGLIKLQKSLPIDKLAQALNKTEQIAENLIYELAAEGIDGELEGGVFKFTNPQDEVISKIKEKIEKL